jgi:hypothetical protein
MYIPALAEGALDPEQDANDQSFYWCNKTLSALGRTTTRSIPASASRAALVTRRERAMLL